MKKIFSVIFLACLVIGIMWCGKGEAEQNRTGEIQNGQSGEEQIGQEEVLESEQVGTEDPDSDGEGGSNLYFCRVGKCLEARIQYEDTNTGEIGETNIEFVVSRMTDWYGENYYEGGILYQLRLGVSNDIVESLDCQLFYVTPYKIYRVHDYFEQDGERIPISDLPNGVWDALRAWRTKEELIQNSDIVCQAEDMECAPEEGAAGTYVNIQREGNLVTCSRREMGADGNTGFHETFVWKEGGGLVEYRSGYGEETEDFGLERIELSSICLFGTWRMDEIAVISSMYTGTTLDGYREEDLYDSADYIGIELEYTPQMMRLGDEKYENPAYLIMYSTIDGVDRGGADLCRIYMNI